MIMSCSVLQVSLSLSLSLLIPVLQFLFCCFHHTVEQQAGFLGRGKSRAGVPPTVVSPRWKDKGR